MLLVEKINKNKKKYYIDVVFIKPFKNYLIKKIKINNLSLKIINKYYNSYQKEFIIILKNNIENSKYKVLSEAHIYSMFINNCKTKNNKIKLAKFLNNYFDLNFCSKGMKRFLKRYM